MEEGVITIETDLLQKISADQAWYYLICPKLITGSSMSFYCSSEANRDTLSMELGVLFGKTVILEAVPDEILQKTLSKYYIKSTSGSETEKRLLKQDGFLETIINEAYRINSSDIHIETSENEGRVRLRVDGKLIERFKIRKEDYPTLINKIKIKANLDIAEKRLPQDGRIKLTNSEESQDIRVSIVPSIYGEKIVLRLLRKTATAITLDDLGMIPSQIEVYRKCARKSHGIILISGPTGSGKTTTLYATLTLLNNNEVNILTIEDPVEYTIEGITQVHLREDIGLTFSRALRTFLRQDPDIIMLGEIRDVETAQMAVRSALTGHLVLSTIHTNSAWGIVTRLLDMGIPPFLLASTINVAVAQRLVRKLCPFCRKEVNNISPTAIASTKFKQPKKHFEPVGCPSCNFTGYSGRIAAFEVIEITEELRESIKTSRTEINDYINAREINKLSSSAYDLYCKGVTSLDEVFPLLSTDY
jgi:general secretion pathway protein E/type IV pilus assembly protein PilB